MIILIPGLENMCVHRELLMACCDCYLRGNYFVGNTIIQSLYPICRTLILFFHQFSQLVYPKPCLNTNVMCMAKRISNQKSRKRFPTREEQNALVIKESRLPRVYNKTIIFSFRFMILFRRFSYFVVTNLPLCVQLFFQARSITFVLKVLSKHQVLNLC